MSMRFTAVIGFTVALYGCSSGGDKTGGAGNGGGGNAQALCERICDKLGACYGDAGTQGVETFVAQCKEVCRGQPGPSNGVTCTNTNQILAALQVCFDETCNEALDCFDTVPLCQHGS